jgi:hypothetical protein
MVRRWRMQVIERTDTSTVRLVRRFMRAGGVTVLFLIASTAATAMAQESIGDVTETLTTRRDLNGRQVVSKKVVTHLARTKGEEQVVVETYLPSIEGERLTLSRRVRRTTTETGNGRQTVEETEERNRAALSEPLRVVRRNVTTVSDNGTDSSVSERQVFELDVNGRFVLTQTESSSRR